MLYIFDADGTLIEGYLSREDKDFFAPLQVLPGRRERLAVLLAEGHQVGIATNQAGVAFYFPDQAKISETSVWLKMAHMLDALGLPMSTPVAVCFAHPRSKIPAYSDPRAVDRRKPSPLMIDELMEECGVTDYADVLMIGDMETDEQCARLAGVRFTWAHDFFGQVPS